MSRVRSVLATWLLATAIVLVAAMPARAAFTTAEQTELLKLVDGLENISEALRYVAYGIRTGTTTATQTLLADSLGLLILAARDAERANGLLLNVIVEQNGTTAFTTMASQSRRARVALAWFYIDRSVITLGTAGSVLQRAQAANANSVYQDNVRRAREIWVPSARRNLAGISRSLTYASPNPSSYPKVIGPHGEYDNAQWFMWRSHWYLLDMLDSVTAAFRADIIQTDYWSVYKTISSATNILDGHVTSAGTLAGMTLMSSQIGQDPFFRVLDELETMTQDTAERFHEIQREIVTWISHGRTPTLAPLAQALIRLTDSWRHADHGVWRQLTFPDCTDPAGCGGR
jgi:hypothetical protein